VNALEQATSERSSSELAALVGPDNPLAAAFEGTKSGFFVASANGAFVHANQALCDLLGQTTAELRGRALADIVHDDDRARVRDSLRRLVAGNLSRFIGEVRVLRGDGEPVWVEAGVTAVAHAAVHGSLLIGQVRDVSARREMEEALREREQLFRAAFDDAAVAMLLVSAEGTILRGNAALCALLGYAGDDLQGVDVLDLTHADDRPEAQAVMPRLQNGELRKFSVEKRYLRKDGEPVWVEVAIAPVWTPSGDLLCFVTQIVDLTARREAQQKFRMVFDAAGIGISIGTGGMLTETNAAYQQLLGYTGEELSLMHYSDITHPDDRDVDNQAIVQLASGEKASFAVEKRLVRRDGATIWVRVTVTTAPDGSFGIGLIEDITDRRELLARTVEAAEAERMSLAADLHDGPIQYLTVAALKLDRLVNKLARAGHEEAAIDARQVRDEVSAEMSSLRDMMTELRPPVMDERGLDVAVHDTLQTVLADTETSYTVESNLDGVRLAPELETAIYRLIREAATNIRKHATAGHASVRLDTRAETVDVTITDDGSGFDTNQNNGGHVGLITMRERVESLGGTLRIETAMNEGTRVHASFPCHTTRA
jgi:PAS domain S-box-containing protein